MLHPQARTLLSGRQPLAFADERIAQIRALVERQIADDVGSAPPVEQVLDVDCDGVPARLYVPAGAERGGAIVYLHGGGWVFGSVETVDGACRRLARQSARALLSVDYRLAPEHRWPAPIEDVERALAWLRRTLAPAPHGALRIAVAGDSAGAYLATIAARHASDRGEPLDFQALVCPALDPTRSSRSYALMGNSALDAEQMEYFWQALSAGGARVPVEPLRMRLDGLPAALVLTAEHDVLRDEGEVYAHALAEAGVPTVLVRYQGMVHGFFRRLARFDAAAVAVDQVAAAIARALAGPAAATAPRELLRA